MTGRILGLDVGDVRTGVAVSDPLGVIAQAHSVLECVSPEHDADAVRDLVRETESVRVVVGLPLGKDGEHGPQAQKVLAFVALLEERLDVDVVTIDERFSTAGAERMLIQANVRRKRRKQVIDKIAAQQILQVYLDRQANQRARDSS